MLLFGLRSSSIALAGIVLAACGSAESAATQSPASQPAQSVAKSASAPSAGSPIAAASRGIAPAAYYECYFHGEYGLQNSSIISLRIHGPAEYEAMEERGRYSEADGTLRMETGTLAGRVAHVRESSGKPAIVFIRRENEVGGRPTIDISDTWCYMKDA